MSHDIEERYTLYQEDTVKARKAHACHACGEWIRPGDLYVRVFILDCDKNPETVKRCARCQAMHAHLRGLAPGDQWPDENLKCGLDYKEEWNEDPPAEIAALAFALPGETAIESG